MRLLKRSPNESTEQYVLLKVILPLALIVYCLIIPLWVACQLVAFASYDRFVRLPLGVSFLTHMLDLGRYVATTQRLHLAMAAVYGVAIVLYSTGGYSIIKWGWPRLRGAGDKSVLSPNIVRAYNTQLGCSLEKTDPPGVILGPRTFGPYDKSLFVVGLPGSGKTSWTVRNIVHVPGPGIVTSTKRELFGLTAGWFIQQDRPVWVLDCGGAIANLGALALRWSPLAGCQDVAQARKVAGRFAFAAGFGGSTTNGDFWTTQTTNALQWMFVAAAATNKQLDTVLGWIADFGELQKAAATLRDLGHTQGAKFLTDTFSPQALSSGPGSSIMSGVTAALAGFASPALVQACSPSSDQSFSVAQWIQRRGIIYLIGTVEDQKSVAGVIAAFVEDTLEKARLLCTPQRPPIRLVLDEAPNIAVLRTLPEIVTTGRGEGIGADIIGQDLHKFEEAYGRSGARTLRLSCAGELVFGGSRDVDHLRELSALTGEETRQSKSVSVGANARTTTTAERVEARLKAEDIRLLKTNHALLVYGNEVHRVVHLKPYWEDSGDLAKVAQARLWCEGRYFAIDDWPLPSDVRDRAQVALESWEAQHQPDDQITQEEFSREHTSAVAPEQQVFGDWNRGNNDELNLRVTAETIAERRGIPYSEALTVVKRAHRRAKERDCNQIAMFEPAEVPPNHHN